MSLSLASSQLSQNNPKFKGQFVQLPLDLFVPSDAFELLMTHFEGPLDLLLHLIKKNHFDILDIPISEITKQYIDYVDILNKNRFDLAVEYLVMAAWLAEIKSRLLLPRPLSIEEEEEDPRVALILRLQTYEIFKNAAIELNQIPQVNRDTFISNAQLPILSKEIILPNVSLSDLVDALRSVLQQANMMQHHVINKEVLSVRERMTHILERLQKVYFLDFIELFDHKEGKLGVAVTFMAILEMSKQQLIEIIQSSAFSAIHVRLYH